MKLNKTFLVILLLMGAAVLTACDRGVPGKDNSELDTYIANPASEFCIKNGGKLDIRTADDGSQVGYCTIAGKECEEWSLFRGECTEAHVCTDAEKALEACTMEYEPVS